VSGHARQDISPFDYDTIPSAYYDDVFSRGRGAQSKWHHLKFERVAQELEGFARHLDIGCGPGTLIGAYGRARNSVGVDIACSQIEHAREKYGSDRAAFYCSTVAELPVEVRDFDAVTAIEVIEHLAEEDVRLVLAGGIERLRPGGRLVVTTPNFGSAWPLIEIAVNRFGRVSYDVQHINKYRPRSLRRLLEELGLVDVHVEPILLISPFVASLSWSLADRFSRLERPLARRLGLLLLATGLKPG
jgi:2-polyprenyl-3-methyl-5-hydroxy-6-metoxy-1,4-benzoquinol methylase